MNTCLFFDESGNTGANWLDGVQSYFVYGGWLLPEDNIKEAEDIIKAIFHSSKANELKSGYVVSRQMDKFQSLFNQLLNIDALPIFQIADKKYMLAAKLIETFFDYAYNPNVDQSFIGEIDKKKKMADSLAGNNKLLQKFVALIKNGTLELDEMKEIEADLYNHFAASHQQNYANAVDKIPDAGLLAMIGEFQTLSKNGSEKYHMSLVYPALFANICHVEELFSRSDIMVKTCIDELQGFQPMVDEINDIINKKTILHHFYPIKQGSSKDILLLQASDLLCGFIYQTLMKSEKAKDDIRVNNIWINLISINEAFAAKGITVWDICCSKAFDEKIRCLVGLGNETSLP